MAEIVKHTAEVQMSLREGSRYSTSLSGRLNRRRDVCCITSRFGGLCRLSALASEDSCLTVCLWLCPQSPFLRRTIHHCAVRSFALEDRGLKFFPSLFKSPALIKRAAEMSVSFSVVALVEKCSLKLMD